MKSAYLDFAACLGARLAHIDVGAVNVVLNILMLVLQLNDGLYQGLHTNTIPNTILDKNY